LAKRYVRGDQSFCVSQASFRDNARLLQKVAPSIVYVDCLGIDVMNMIDPTNIPLSCGNVHGTMSNPSELGNQLVCCRFIVT
jgi:hypothetical protein